MRWTCLISAWRQNGDSRPLSKKELSSVGTALLKLQRGLTGDRNLAGGGYMDEGSLFGSYLLYYWPVTFRQISYAIARSEDSLESLVKSAGSDKKFEILDVGSGPAPATAAILESLSNIAAAPELAVTSTLVDSGKSALKTGSSILRESFSKSFSSFDCKTFAKNLEGITEKEDFLEGKKYNAIVLSHVLNELWKNSQDAQKKRLDFLEKLISRLGDGGILIINEPAVLESSRNLLSLKEPLVKSGLSVIFPCVKSSSEACPALAAGEKQTCHTESPWLPLEPADSLAKIAGLDRSSFKMTCFIFIKSSGKSKEKNEDHVTAASGISGLVVSDGMLNKAGRLRFVICDGQKRVTVSAKKGDPMAAEKGFFKLTRGKKVSVLNPEIRGEKDNPSFGIQAESKIVIS